MKVNTYFYDCGEGTEFSFKNSLELVYVFRREFGKKDQFAHIKCNVTLKYTNEY